MTDKEFGRLVLFLIRSEIGTEQIGTILWEMWNEFGDKKTGEWKTD